MAKINTNFLNLNESYLFVEIARRVKAYKEANPDRDVISLGIGDVTLPLADAVVKEMENGGQSVYITGKTKSEIELRVLAESCEFEIKVYISNL